MVFSFRAWVRIKDLTFPSQKKRKDKRHLHDNDFPRESDSCYCRYCS